MKLAIMQPYIFPYVGYFQLIASVDKFVVYDDVAYIKQGWINRNRILLNDKDHLFTLPLQDASPNKLIRQICLHPALYESWKEKFYKTLEAAYKKAPFYTGSLSLVKEVLNTSAQNISKVAENSIKAVCSYAGITPVFVSTATEYNNSNLKSVERVIDICKQENAATYVNAIGGKVLYGKNVFSADGIELKFLQPAIQPYPQYTAPFVPGLSIIDLLMFNSQEQLRRHFLNYSLVD